jgi:hypothetical protein
MLSVIMLSVIMLSAIMLSVIIQNAIMLSVTAIVTQPHYELDHFTTLT